MVKCHHSKVCLAGSSTTEHLHRAWVYSNHPELLLTSEIYPSCVYCDQLEKHTFFPLPCVKH